MSQIEQLLDNNGPVALVIKESLRPVSGNGSVIFPPTYAPDKDAGQRKSGYNIDDMRSGKRCTIDSVQSQANRIEQLFMESPYDRLVPQIEITSGDKTINLLEAAHRLADAAVLFSGLEAKAKCAFHELLEKGNSCNIAKLSPMSIIFGAWDSRGTHAKLPRILGSTIVAEDVEVLTRSSQFVPSFTVDVMGLSEEELSEQEKEKWSRVGLAHAPGKGLGGVVVHGDITREATMNLVALRHLKGNGEEETLLLRSYILSLALVCATIEQDHDLRSGCHLVRNGNDALEAKLVYRDGREEAFQLDHAFYMQEALMAAKAFGISGDGKEVVSFSADKAKESLEGAKAHKANKARKGNA